MAFYCPFMGFKHVSLFKTLGILNCILYIVNNLTGIIEFCYEPDPDENLINKIKDTNNKIIANEVKGVIV